MHTTGTAGQLVGRAEELSRVAAVVDAAIAGRGPYLGVWGPPGSGKSALLAHVTDPRVLVLRAAGDASEADIRAAVLHQLIGRLRHPGPRQTGPDSPDTRALLGAAESVLADRSGSAESISDALGDLIDRIARELPTIVVVDDVDLSDPVSADVLARLATAQRSWGVVFAGRRRPEVLATPTGDLALRPLGDEDSRRLVEATAEAPGSVDAPGTEDARRRRRIVDDIVARAAGNPGVLVLSARALVTPEVLRADSTVDVVRRADSAVATVWLPRTDLSSRARELGLLWAVALDCPGPPAIPPVPESVVDPLALAELLDSGVLVPGPHGPAPVHPLLPAAVLELAASGEQRRAHERLADAFSAVEMAGRTRTRTAERHEAWHRARATTTTDDAVGTRLDRTTDDLAPAPRARALEVAAALSSDTDVRADRLARAAEATLSAGDLDAAAILVNRVQAGEPRADGSRTDGSGPDGSGPDGSRTVARARSLLVEGLAAAASRTPQEGFERSIRAAELARGANGDVELAALSAAAEVAWWSGRADWVERVARVARQVERAGTSERIALDAIRGSAALFAGDLGDAGAALCPAVAAGDGAITAGDHRMAGQAAILVGDDIAAAHHLTESARLSRAGGDVFRLAFTLQALASVETWRGRLGRAELLLAEGDELSRRIGDERSHAFGLTMSAHADALRGAGESTRRSTDAALRLVTGRDVGYIAAGAFWTRGRADLAAGRLGSALEILQEVVDPDSASANPPTALFALPDLVEAAVRSGRADIARAAVPRFAAWADAGSPWARAVLPRLRALTADDDNDAEAWFARGTDIADRPFERARTQLLHGEQLRRRRQRVRARAVLDEARQAFHTLGITAWEHRATTELTATAERARRGPEASTELTPQELTVARLVADGATNQQVAEQLFLSRKTVESHLHKVYTKLGIGSRKQLAGALRSV